MSERIGPVGVRRARPAEYERVGALTEQGYRADGHLDRPAGEDEGYGATLRDARSRAERSELVVAADGDDLLGTVTWCPAGSDLREVATSDEQGEFRMLAVSPSARRRGVGALLVDWCIERACADGLREVVMCSMAQMAPAHALYARFGFVRRPDLDWSPVAGVDLLGFGLALDRRPGPS